MNVNIPKFFQLRIKILPQETPLKYTWFKTYFLQDIPDSVPTSYKFSQSIISNILMYMLAKKKKKNYTDFKSL